MGEDDGSEIPLAATLEKLRGELQQAIDAGADQDLRFRVDSLEVELTITVSRETGMGGGIKFWVLNASGQKKASDLNTHKVKLTLTPLGRSGKQVEVSSREDVKPVLEEAVKPVLR